MAMGVVVTAALPVGDWQFWVATAIAGVAAGWLCWRLWRAVRSHRRGAGKRVELTLDRKAVPYGRGEAGRRIPEDR